MTKKEVFCASFYVALAFVVWGLSWPHALDIVKEVSNNHLEVLSQQDVVDPLVPEIVSEPIRDDRLCVVFVDVFAHTQRVNEASGWLRAIANDDRVVSEDDVFVKNAYTRIHELNNEREYLLDQILLNPKVYPDLYTAITSSTIMPAWRNLADSSSALDRAIEQRSRLFVSGCRRREW